MRQRTSAALWRKPLRWAALAREGLLPDGAENPDGHRPRVFCASLADVFEPRPELEPWRLELLRLIEDTPELDWLVLTKRPDVAAETLRLWHALRGPLRLRPAEGKWNERDGIGWACPANIWIGTSIENSRFTWRADWLRRIPAPVRFISAEPLVGSLFLGPTSGESPAVEDAPRQPDAGSIPAGSTQDRVQPGTPDGATAQPHAKRGEHGAGSELDGAARHRSPLDLTGIDWVIVGGESGGRNARPMHPRWAWEIRDAVLARRQAGLDEAFLYGAPDEIIHQGVVDEMMGRDGPALHFKQWGSWAPDPRGLDPRSVFVQPDGRMVSPLAADATGGPADGSMRMRYVGASPKSGGKLLDGVEYCEFPEPDRAA